MEYSLSQIEERLKELDEEKAHLRVYNELNLQRRTIQYVMCWREIEEINENISGLDEIRKGCADDISALNLKLDKLQSAISFDERQMEYLRGRIKTLCADREELSRNIEKSLKTRAGLEMDLLHIKDIDTLDKSHNNADEKQLKTLAISIAEREDALAKCTERIASARKLEVSLSDR